VEYRLGKSSGGQSPLSPRTIRSEALPPGERRLIQPGINGEEEIVYRVTLEDGVEKGREIVSTRVITPAQDEIVVVGVGKIPVLSPDKRNYSLLIGWERLAHAGFPAIPAAPSPLGATWTVESLSSPPDGKYLLFTRREEGQKLNSLWVVTATIAGEETKATRAGRNHLRRMGTRDRRRWNLPLCLLYGGESLWLPRLEGPQ